MKNGGFQNILKDHIHIIKVILNKDCNKYKSILMGIIIFSLILSIFSYLYSTANEINRDEEKENIRETYVIVSFVLLISIFSIFWSSELFGKEFSEMTIRTLSLYPYSISQLSLSKWINVVIFTLYSTLLLFLIPLSIFFSITSFLSMNFIILTYFLILLSNTGIVLLSYQFSNIILSFYPKSKFWPTNSLTFFLVISILFTEIFINEVGNFIYSIHSNSTTSSSDTENINLIADCLSPFSLYHFSGQLISYFSGNGSSIDYYIIIIYLFFLIPFGYLLGKKMYWIEIL